MSGMSTIDQHTPREARLAGRVPLNIFGMGFGLAGLATTWRVAAGFDLAPAWVGTVLAAIATVVWLSSAALYLRYLRTSRGVFGADLNDRTAGPFASLAVITPLLLAADGIAPYSPGLAAVVVDVFLVLTVLLGAWFTGTWMRGGLDIDRLHPGYFLPTVAGGLVAAACAADIGQTRLAQVMFGLGMICWLIVGSMILARLIFRPPLPAALAPTMAIEVAPAAVASLAYFALNGGHLDPFVAAIGGYGLLMVLAQLSLITVYRRLSFALSTWAFTFSWAAVASATLYWIALGQLAGAHVYSYVVLAAITLVIAAVAGRTVLAVMRGQLLPPAAPAPLTASGPPRARIQ